MKKLKAYFSEKMSFAYALAIVKCIVMLIKSYLIALCNLSVIYVYIYVYIYALFQLVDH